MSEHLFLPGPTLTPPSINTAMSHAMIDHNEEDFGHLFMKVREKCKKVFQTENDVYMLTCSGTGAMEAAISSTFSKGDKVIALVGGHYGDRMARIAENYHLNVIRLSSTWGEALDLDQLEKTFVEDKDHEIKAVLVTHNESSTGVTNDLKKISRICGDHPALIIVDAISSAGGIQLKADEWDLDVVFTASQNALMVSPGLSLITFSERAWKKSETSDLPKFYLDLKAYKEAAKEGESPYTPAIPLIKALDESIDLILKEGLENRFLRHERMRDMLRAGLKAVGLDLLTPEDIASPTLTSAIAPKGIDVDDMIDYLRNNFNVVVGEGQKKLKGKVFRIGHMGHINEVDILTLLSTLEIALKDLEYPVELGSGVKEAQKIFLDNKVNS